MKKSIIALLLIVPAIMQSQLINFSYDTSGNRIQRKRNTPPKPPTPPSQDTHYGISALAMTASRVYPVPVTEVLTVEVGEIMSGSLVNISIHDIAGQIMTTLDTSEAKVEIDVADYPKGFYLVSIGTRDQREVHKIIKN